MDTIMNIRVPQMSVSFPNASNKIVSFATLTLLTSLLGNDVFRRYIKNSNTGIVLKKTFCA